MRIGVISDTHNFLDPRVAGLLDGVEHILHGGDIGAPRLLRDLERIAPVTAVAGNTDEQGFQYPETQLVELAGVKFLLHHIIAPRQLSDAIKERIVRDKPGVIIFGHTHKPFHEWVGGTLFFNPGYAGKSRFGMERSVAILNCDNKSISWQYYPL
jgi:hypothetical protein